LIERWGAKLRWAGGREWSVGCCRGGRRRGRQPVEDAIDDFVVRHAPPSGEHEPAAELGQPIRRLELAGERQRLSEGV
jgi:hypothetical protein